MKALIWVGSSKEDFCEFPDDVQRAMGYGLYLAQTGGRHSCAKTLKGFGNAKVVELRVGHVSGAYRAVYVVSLGACVFVLHAFQKKSKSGIATDAKDVNLVKRRLKEAEEVERSFLVGE